MQTHLTTPASPDPSPRRQFVAGTFALYLIWAYRLTVVRLLIPSSLAQLYKVIAFYLVCAAGLTLLQLLAVGVAGWGIARLRRGSLGATQSGTSVPSPGSRAYSIHLLSAGSRLVPATRMQLLIPALSVACSFRSHSPGGFQNASTAGWLAGYIILMVWQLLPPLRAALSTAGRLLAWDASSPHLTVPSGSGPLLRREWLFASILLLVCEGAFFSPVLTQHQTINPAGFALIWPGFGSYATADQRDYNPIASDFADSDFPFMISVRASLIKTGHFPLTSRTTLSTDNTNVSMFGGVLFSVDAPLVYLLGAAWGMTLAVLLRFFVWGLFTFAFLRLWEVEFGIAIFAAVAASYTSYQVVNAWLPYMFNLPLLFYFTERLIRRPSRALFVGLTLTYAASVLCGNPVWGVYLIAFQLLYVPFRLWALPTPPHARTRALLLIGAAAAGSILVALFAILPSLELQKFLDLGYRAQNSATFQSHWLDIMAFFPTIAGELRAPLSWGSNFVEVCRYVGIAPLLILGLFPFFRSRPGWFFLGATVLIYGIVTNTFGILTVVRKVPFFDKSSNTRLRFLWAFLVPVAAAFVLDKINAVASPGSVNARADAAAKAAALRRRSGSALYAAIAAALLAILALGALSLYLEPSQQWAGGTINFKDTFVAGQLRLQSLKILMVVALLAQILWAHQKQFWILGLAAFTFMDLFAVQSGYLPYIEAVHTFPPTRFTSFLLEHTQADEGRVLPLGRALISNFGSAYDISSIQPRGFYTPRQKEFFTLIDPDALQHHPTQYFFNPEATNLGAGAIDLLHVRYLLVDHRDYTPAMDARLAGRWRKVYSDEMLIYQNQHLTALATFAGDIRVETDPARALALLRTLDPASSAVVEDSALASQFKAKSSPKSAPPDSAPSSSASPATRDASRSATRKTSVTATGPQLEDDYHFTVEAPTAGILVFSKMYNPAWKVYVDDQTQPVLVTDYVLMGAVLTPGHHEVRFAFEPLGFAIAWKISLATLIMLAGLLVVPSTVLPRFSRESTASL